MMQYKTKYVFKYMVLNKECWIKIHVFYRRRSGIRIVNKFDCSKIHHGYFIPQEWHTICPDIAAKIGAVSHFCNNRVTIPAASSYPRFLWITV